MKKEAYRHPKFKRLARALRINLVWAEGLASRLWHITATLTPHGNIGKLSNEDIADELEFDVERADELVAALVDVRLIDESDTFRLVVHDWPDHCEESVHLKLARKTEFFADGTRPKYRRLTRSEKDYIDGCYDKLEQEMREQESTRHAHGMHTEGAQHAHGMTTENTLPVSCPVSYSYSLPLPLPIPDKNTPTECSSESLPTPQAAKPDFQPIVDSWNAVAADVGLPAIRSLTKNRKRILGQRLRDPAWREQWRQALDKVRGSPFCRGENNTGWRMDFEYFIKPDSVTKILEGKYDDRKQESVF